MAQIGFVSVFWHYSLSKRQFEGYSGEHLRKTTRRYDAVLPKVWSSSWRVRAYNVLSLAIAPSACFCGDGGEVGLVCGGDLGLGSWPGCFCAGLGGRS